MSHIKEIKKEILASVTIASLAGTRSNRMQCPFHGSESLDMQLFHEDNKWKCWGKCNTMGNVFDWIMCQDGVDFKTAFHQLAEYAGIPVTPSQERVDILQASQNYFHEQLLENPEAMSYLHRRGFSEDHIFRRRLGWAGKGEFPTEVPIRKLEQVGLIRSGQTGPYPYFRDRIVYPIYDRNLNLLQMQGRTISPEVEPKYLALPQEVEFPGRSIWQCLAGEEILRDRAVSEVWLCEGWPDRETLTAWGIHAFGLFGHSGLEKHSYRIETLKRVYVCLDNDEASQKGLLNKLYLLAMRVPHVEFVIVLLPVGMDLNDYARQDRLPNQFLSPDRDSNRIEDLMVLAQSSPTLIETLITAWTREFHNVEPLVRLIARIPDRERWTHRLATQLGESVTSINLLIKVLAPVA